MTLHSTLTSTSLGTTALESMLDFVVCSSHLKEMQRVRMALLLISPPSATKVPCVSAVERLLTELVNPSMSPSIDIDDYDDNNVADVNGLALKT